MYSFSLRAVCVSTNDALPSLVMSVQVGSKLPSSMHAPTSSVPILDGTERTDQRPHCRGGAVDLDAAGQVGGGNGDGAEPRATAQSAAERTNALILRAVISFFIGYSFHFERPAGM